MDTNAMSWLQQWYWSQCNDQWEHHFGITIETLDNPGWLVKIALAGTPLDGRSMKPVNMESVINHHGIEGNQNWLHCTVEGNKFIGAGGPFSLVQICEVFKQWAESVRVGN